MIAYRRLDVTEAPRVCLDQGGKPLSGNGELSVNVSIRRDDLNSRHGRLVLLAHRLASRGGMSRVAAARRLGLSPGETRPYLDQLTKWGLLTEVGAVDARHYVASDEQLATAAEHLNIFQA